MKRLLPLAVLLGCASCATQDPEDDACASGRCGGVAQPPAVVDALHTPWRNPRNALVIDLYEKNTLDWDRLAGAPRVAAIIHRASKGLVADAAYARRRSIARQRGYCWGSFHVGTTNDPVQQADFYLRTIGAAEDEVMALDLEDVTGGKFMNIGQAQAFLRRIQQKTGRFPLVYAGRQTILAIRQTPGRSHVFARTCLWYARYADAATDIPAGIWRDYTLWQFACESRHGAAAGSAFLPIPGTRTDIDVSVFNGSADELRRQWPFVGLR